MVESHRQEAQRENSSNLLSTLSDLVPNIDPSVLISAVEEIKDMIEAGHRLKGLGIIFDFQLSFELRDGEIVNLKSREE